MSRSDLGLVQVYYGSGKGKTTCALGLGLRAAGHGFRVCMIQFMKGDTKYGELKSAEQLSTLSIYQFGRPDLIADPDETDLSEGRKAMEMARERLSSGEHDIVILDEVGVAVDMGVVDVDDLISALDGRGENVEVVLTGRTMHPRILEMADLVTEMKMVKHPFSTMGTKARKGIEF